MGAALAARAGRAPDQVEPKVAASITHLGLTARLIAPALAAAACQSHLDMRLEGLRWQAEVGGPVPLSVPQPPDPTSGRHDPEMLKRDPLWRLLDEVITPLTSTTSRLIAVSERVLWGNVASAINGAATQIATQLPDLIPAAQASAASLADHPRLGHERRPPGPDFRRTSCCLLYKLTPGPPRPVCGDCILHE
jgi:ferric iron reductase protein FhuF